MKKAIAMLTLAALALTATPVFAKEGKDHGERHVKLNIVEKFLSKSVKNNRFVLLGTISAVGTSTLVVDVERGTNASGSLTIAVNGDTEIEARPGDDDDDDLTLANLAVGQKVLVKGKISDGNFTASSVKVINTAAIDAKLEKRQVAVGSVTAKTDTSLTIKNSLTGTEKTVALTPETEVKINGETKTSADIQVGDSGWVKFKTELNAFVATMVKLFR